LTTTERVLLRVDANTGEWLSNVSIVVHSSKQSYLVSKQECDNVLYSFFGDGGIFDILVANDASTGEWIWQTPDEGVLEFVVSANCKFVTILLDPLDNTRNMSLVRLDAKTGEIIWNTILDMNRMIALQWDWFITESDTANRIVVARFKLSNAYSFQLFSADAGKKTFEIAETKPVKQSTATFSRDGSLVLFSPLQTIAIKISGTQDVHIWSTGGTEGIASATYFSDTGKTVLLNLWNYGLYKFLAQNTTDGSLIWESSWSDINVIEFLENGSDLFVFSPHALYRVDLIKCPLL